MKLQTYVAMFVFTLIFVFVIIPGLSSEGRYTVTNSFSQTVEAASFSGGGSTLDNPLKFNTIDELLTGIISVLLIFAVPIIILFIMYAGFLYVTAQGDTTKIQTAHSALTWAVVGGLIVLGAEVIKTIIQGTVGEF